MDLSTLFSEQFISALGWTLFHSLWQGLLVALILSSILILMRANNSRVRLMMSYASLFVILALSIRTFNDCYQKPVELVTETNSAQTVLYQPNISLDQNKTVLLSDNKEELSSIEYLFLNSEKLINNKQS